MSDTPSTYAAVMAPRQHSTSTSVSFHRHGRLHLHDEWNADMLISESVVPWTSEWLLHYELWLATDEWLGGGHELGPKQ